jgi:hypothetical protein
MNDERRSRKSLSSGLCDKHGGRALAFCVGVYRYCREIDVMASQFQLATGPQATLLYDRTGVLVFSLHEEERVTAT